MANVPNTTSSCLGTRHLVEACTPVIPTVPSQPGQTPEDPVLTLWEKWPPLHAEVEDKHREWQKLEALLFRTVGFPNAAVPTADEESLVHVTSHADIDNLLGEGAETAVLRNQLHSDLTAHQARWDTAKANVQFDAAEARHRTAFAQLEDLTEEIFRAPAGSFAGLAIKLALIARTGETIEGDSEFPWPQIRSVLCDLRRLADLPHHVERVD